MPETNQTGATSVRFNGVAAVYKVTSSSEIPATEPSEPPPGQFRSSCPAPCSQVTCPSGCHRASTPRPRIRTGRSTLAWLLESGEESVNHRPGLWGAPRKASCPTRIEPKSFDPRPCSFPGALASIRIPDRETVVTEYAPRCHSGLMNRLSEE
jgi:hypothetical protein